MAMVVVELPKKTDSQPKSCGLVWGSAAAWRCSTFTRWTEWTLAMTWSWWQHYKYRRVIIIIITFIDYMPEKSPIVIIDLLTDLRFRHMCVFAITERRYRKTKRLFTISLQQRLHRCKTRDSLWRGAEVCEATWFIHISESLKRLNQSALLCWV